MAAASNIKLWMAVRVRSIKPVNCSEIGGKRTYVILVRCGTMSSLANQGSNVRENTHG